MNIEGKMTPEAFGLLSSSLGLPQTYAQQAEESHRNRQNKVRHLLQHRKIPDEGWPEDDIEDLLRDFALMDSNNFPGNCGVGEREARVFSKLVSRRHFGTGHGIGRSGDLCEIQPKAAGSSSLNQLTNALVLDLLRQFGVRSAKAAFVVPMATGMAVTLTLLALRKVRPTTAKYVLWSRIDQKSCFKSILAAGFEPVIIQLKKSTKEGQDQYETDLEAMEAKMEELGVGNILCVMTTTSCFAPRAADDLVGVGGLTKPRGIPHVINNAYGVQSSKCMHLIETCPKTAHDVFIQSTDKNLMVPVGGAVIAGFDKGWVGTISKTYPGRASSSPTIDVFITLMSMGVEGYKRLVKERKENFVLLKQELGKVAEKYGERVLESKDNPISVAMTLTSVPDASGEGKAVSDLGAMLFTRGVSGTRVLTGKDVKKIEGYEFKSWGSHSDDMDIPYLTAAAAIGMTKSDVELFVKRLDKVLGMKTKK